MASLSSTARLRVMPRAKPSTTTSEPAALPEVFVIGARDTISCLCTAIERLLKTSPTNVARATDLQAVLGVRMSLAWQIFKIAQIEEPLDTVTYIPRPDSMKKLLTAADEAGFSKEVIGDVDAAYEKFTAFVGRHAGDRGSFDAMIAALGGQAAEQVDLRDRRAAFRADSNIWGVQSRVLYRCAIRQRSEDNESDTAIMIFGCLGLHALRRVPSLPLMRRVIVLKERNKEESYEQTQQPVKVLTDFCSRPIPRIETSQVGGPFHHMLQLNGVGQTARIDCFALDEVPGLATGGQTWSAAAFIHSPCEYLIQDFLLPSGWCMPETAVAKTFGNVAFVEQAVRRSDDLLMPAKETVQYFGTSIDALHDPLFPRAPELVRHVLKDKGWFETEFDVFRCVVRYPILHSAVEVVVGLVP